VFYSDTLRWGSIAVAIALAASVLLLQRVHVRATSAYAVLGAGMWLALHGSGVSPTLAAVAVGFLTPAAAYHRPSFVSREAHRVADETVDEPRPPDADAAQWMHLAGLTREAVSPLVRLENSLRPWAIFVVIPLFALANAGVVLSIANVGAVLHSRFAGALILARVVGKTVGISGAIILAVRARLARLPERVGTGQVVGMAAVAGIPFTVSIFIAELSLSPALVEVAKLSVLIAAAVSAGLAFALARVARVGRGSAA
jgi:Na+:H+ antiporter, NhaA family